MATAWFDCLFKCALLKQEPQIMHNTLLFCAPPVDRVSKREGGKDTRLLRRNSFICNNQQYCWGCLGMLKREKKRKKQLAA